MSLMYGRMNLSPGEDLVTDDMTRLRFTYVHAVKQFLGYKVPTSDADAEKIFPEIGAAIVAADAAVYKKKKRGKGHDSFNAKVAQIKQELADGLLGKGVLERYYPAGALQLQARQDVAKSILDWTKKAGLLRSATDDAPPELVLKSRAVALMHARLPSFEAYTWDCVKRIGMAWADIHWHQRGHPPSQVPAVEMGEQVCKTDEEYVLLVSASGVELKKSTLPSWNFRIPFSRGRERRHLTGWQPLPDDIVALSILAWQQEEAKGGRYVTQGLALHVPAGAAVAIGTLLSMYA